MVRFSAESPFGSDPFFSGPNREAQAVYADMNQWTYSKTGVD